VRLVFGVGARPFLGTSFFFRFTLYFFRTHARSAEEVVFVMLQDLRSGAFCVSDFSLRSPSPFALKLPKSLRPSLFFLRWGILADFLGVYENSFDSPFFSFPNCLDSRTPKFLLFSGTSFLIFYATARLWGFGFLFP